MSGYIDDKPTSGEDLSSYTKRLEAEGQREIYIRKALREHFGLEIKDAIAACSGLSAARHLELKELRTRFPDMNENRLAWKISKTLTIPREDAMIWAQTLIAEEDGV